MSPAIPCPTARAALPGAWRGATIAAPRRKATQETTCWLQPTLTGWSRCRAIGGMFATRIGFDRSEFDIKAVAAKIRHCAAPQKGAARLLIRSIPRRKTGALSQGYGASEI